MMCISVVCHDPASAWPVIAAVLRHAPPGRPWSGPGRHWPDRPDVVAGLDAHENGAWVGVNDHGVLATVVNGGGTPPDGRLRSRGELVLEALDHADAVEAARSLGDLNVEAYAPFTMLIGDSRDLYRVHWPGVPAPSVVQVRPLSVGCHVAVDGAPADAEVQERRIGTALRSLTAADLLHETGGPGEPVGARWTPLIHALAAALPEPPSPTEADTERPTGPAERVHTSLIALPAPGRDGARSIWAFGPGSPGTDGFVETLHQVMDPAG